MADDIKIIVDYSQVAHARTELSQVRTEIDNINRRSVNINVGQSQRALDNYTQSIQRQHQEMDRLINDAIQGYGLLAQAINAVNQAMGNPPNPQWLQDNIDLFRDLIDQQHQYQDNQDDLADHAAQAWERIGNAISSVGDIMQATNTVAEQIGTAFSNMASIFEVDIASKVTDTLTQMATEATVGNINEGIARADIMNTFSRYMSLVGIGDSASSEALARVNQSILGLPIGLDESAQRLRRYNMYLDNLEDATNLTIGLQKAIIAGGASEQNKNNAYYQIDRLLSVGKLNTARQWNALINGLGVSVRYLGEAMGVGAVNSRELAAGLSNGTYSADQLLKGLMRLGDETSGYATKLDSALEIYKSTYESWMKNIEFAMVRGTERVINSLNTALEEGTGGAIIDYMREFRDGLNRMYAGVGDFLTSHPEQIANIISSARELFGIIGNLNGTQIGEGAISNITQLIDIIGSVLNRFSGDKAGRFIAFATTLAGPLGKLFDKAGDFASMMGVFQRFENFDFNYLVDSTVSKGTALTNFVTSFLRIFDDKTISNVVSFGLIYGKPLGDALKSIGSAVASFGTSAAGVRVFERLLEAHPGLAQTVMHLGGFATVITAVATAVGGLILLQQHNKQRRLIDLGLDDIDEEIKKADRLRSSINDTISDYYNQSKTLQYNEERARDLIEEIKNLDDTANNAEGFANLQFKVAELQQFLPDLSIAFDEETGHIDEASRALLENAAAIDQVIASSKALAIQSAINSAISEMGELYVSQARLKTERSQATTGLAFARHRLEYLRGLIQYDANGRVTGVAQNPEGLSFTDVNNEINELGRDTIPLYEEAIAKANAELANGEAEMAKYESAIDRMRERFVEETVAAKEAGEAAEEWKNAQSGAAEAADTTTEAVEQQTESFHALRDAALEAADAEFKVFQQAKVDTPTKQELTSGMQSQIDMYNDYMQSAQEISDYIKEHPENTGFASMISEVLNDYPEFVDRTGILSTIASDIESFATEGTEQYAQLAAATTGAADATAALQTNLEGVADGSVLAQQHLESLMALFPNANPAAFEEYQYYDGDLSMNQFVHDGELGTVKVVDGIVDGLESGAPRVTNAVMALRAPVEKLPKDIESQAPAAASAASSVVSSIAAAFGTDIGGSIASFVSRTISEIQAGIAAIQAAASGIHISGSGTTHGGGGGKIPHNATYDYLGGVVYAANGMFIPVGTDTVPAMLTPGEFVVNRGATRRIGADVLSMINRYDFGGAVEAMMHKFPTPQSQSFVTNNVHNSDSHNNFTMNVNTQNPQFAERISSRYI